MNVDFLHNKIISDSITEKFTESIKTVLVPMLEERYGNNVVEIQMYEDHLADEFLRDGNWYYPLTVVLADRTETVWIKWDVSDKSRFDCKNPYAYKGSEAIDFCFAEPPIDFEETLNGRSRYFEGGTVKVTVDAATTDPAVLAGKYSQTFIDEMARQLTREISRAMSVEGLPESNVELRLVFAPETYMEHTSENVTYRRLLITDKACGARDFWIKWTRQNSAVAYSVSDTPAQGEVIFELGEDVPQKIREREYRFLVRADTDKYHVAMGRKNITEWRDLIKRAIRRGDLTRVVCEVEIAEHSAEVHDKLSSILSSFGMQPSTEQITPEVKEADSEFEEAMRKAHEAVFGAEESETEELSVPDAPFDFSATEQLDNYGEFAVEESEGEDKLEVEESLEEENELETLEELELLEPDDEEESDSLVDDGEISEDEATTKSAPFVDEERIRAEVEAKIRLEYETLARQRAEEEAAKLRLEREREREESERLRREHSMLMAEHERLMAEARKLEEQKLQGERNRAAEEQRLRDEIEARIKAENRERERLAEAARLAIEAQKRAEEEKAEAERRRIEEERRAEEAQRRAEEEARIKAQRIAEAERIRLETEMARGNVVYEDTAEEQEQKPDVPKEIQYTYVSKRVRLLFKHLLDPNITKRIYDIIKTTIEFYHKENVYIRIKATTPDESTVLLDFLKIPEEETELLINIIKVLGNSNIGISKAIIE